jgi:hypothetical protein
MFSPYYAAGGAGAGGGAAGYSSRGAYGYGARGAYGAGMNKHQTIQRNGRRSSCNIIG